MLLFPRVPVCDTINKDANIRGPGLEHLLDLPGLRGPWFESQRGRRLYYCLLYSIFIPSHTIRRGLHAWAYSRLV